MTAINVVTNERPSRAVDGNSGTEEDGLGVEVGVEVGVGKD